MYVAPKAGKNPGFLVKVLRFIRFLGFLGSLKTFYGS